VQGIYLAKGEGKRKNCKHQYLPLSQKKNENVAEGWETQENGKGPGKQHKFSKGGEEDERN